jgi:uncharacterized protein (TIGR02145 family)
MKKLITLILLLSFTIKAQEIKIGTQTWTTKNLDVTKYRNGDAIPQVQDKNAWAKLKTGAWCYYENKTANGKTYGKLYNWYAVNDPRGLAPKGYHIPTDEEWTILTDYLGGDSIAGTKMKSTSGWENEGNELFLSIFEGNGSNSIGFAGLPGGCRIIFNGDFYFIGDDGFWWSSSEDYTSGAWYRGLNNFDGNVDRTSLFKLDGFSVRCLSD